MRKTSIALFAVFCCAFPSRPARAAGPAEVFGTAGATKLFLDEPFQASGGGGIRIPLFDRVAVSGEALFTRADSFNNRFFLASATYDLRHPRRAVVPYLIGGGGLMSESDKRIPFSFHQATWLGGAGIRFAIGKRLTLSPAFRAGPDALPLVTLHVGFRLGSLR